MNKSAQITLMRIEHRLHNLRGGQIHLESLIHASEREDTHHSLLNLISKITQEIQQLDARAFTLRQELNRSVVNVP